MGGLVSLIVGELKGREERREGQRGRLRGGVVCSSMVGWYYCGTQIGTVNIG